MMHKFAEFVANGQTEAEMILVESEHSALSAAVGASAAGARTITATCSAGFALMWEILYVAASLRCPICMGVVNRALSGNINIHNDHSDAMGGRDAGWVQIYCENAQETYDTGLMSFRIAEHPSVRLPVMINYDGFIISHTADALQMFDDETAYRFIGPYKPAYALLDLEKPITVGPLDLTDYYFEHKISEMQAHERAFDVVRSVFAEYSELSGRRYDLYEAYRLDDAEFALVVLGSSAGTAKDVIDEYRDRGVKVGLLKLRLFRPFPAAEIAAALSGLKAVAVMDKSVSFGGWGGPVFTEIRSALYESPNGRPPVHNWIYGLGGRDVDLKQIAEVIETTADIARGKSAATLNLLGVRL
jgi:pyruvate ferredoxin oxidoreductase alpha subunit